MMMRLKCVSSSIYSSFCRHKAANPIFSSSKLRYFSSSLDSSTPLPHKSRFDNPYIDRWGDPTRISMDQLEEFLKDPEKYPVMSLEDSKKQNISRSFYHIPHPDLVGNEDLEVKVNPENWDNVWYVDSEEEEDEDPVIIGPRSFGDPPIISEEEDAKFFPPLTDFRRKHEQNHETNSVPNEEREGDAQH